MYIYENTLKLNMQRYVTHTESVATQTQMGQFTKSLYTDNQITIRNSLVNQIIWYDDIQ